MGKVFGKVETDIEFPLALPQDTGQFAVPVQKVKQRHSDIFAPDVVSFPVALVRGFQQAENRFLFHLVGGRIVVKYLIRSLFACLPYRYDRFHRSPGRVKKK